MVSVKISETYDLSTVIGSLGVIGIHTPSAAAIGRLWSGFQQNYRFMKFTGCDVSMACASMLPADPLQIGTESGDIAPADMFNPILYKAVSNESFENILAKMKAGQDLVVGNSVSEFDINSTTETPLSAEDILKAYYALP